MTQPRRQAVLIGTMVAMLAIAAVWNVNWMLGERERARRAAADLAACREIARQIESLREKPEMASSEAMGVQELGQRITAAARKADLEDRRPRSVNPQSGRYVGDSPYKRKPTVLTLEGVSLRQTAVFLYHLTEGSKLSVPELRLSAPRGSVKESDDERWRAKAKLTYLLYEPRADR